ncbi:hypothetical protein HDU67_009343 [Dinochytrium kinnereticum]|nr:hypothetical protein HDU67_009343 [Dinochytrium kinnereticum]
MPQAFLPTDIIQHHLSPYLNLQDLATLHSTSRHCRAACLPYLLRDLDFRRTSVEKFLRAFPSMSGIASLVQSLAVRFELGYDAVRLEEMLKVLSAVGPFVRRLTVDGGVLEGEWGRKVARHLKQCQNVRWICLSDCYCLWTDEEDEMGMGLAISTLERLEGLELHFSEEEGSHVLPKALSSTIPTASLSTLALSGHIHTDALFTFLTNQPNLKSLTLSLPNTTPIPSPKSIDETFSNLHELTTLHLTLPSTWAFRLTLLKHMRHLKSFKFNGQLLCTADWNAFMDLWRATTWPLIRSFEIDGTRVCTRNMARDLLLEVGTSPLLTCFGFKCGRYLIDSEKGDGGVSDFRFTPSKSLQSLSYHPPAASPPSKLFPSPKEWYPMLFPDLGPSLRNLSVGGLTVDSLQKLLPSVPGLRYLDIHFQKDVCLKKLVPVCVALIAAATRLERLTVGGNVAVEKTFATVLQQHPMKRFSFFTATAFPLKSPQNPFRPNHPRA